MEKLSRIGSVIFAVGIGAFGVLNFAFSDFVVGLEPVPSWIPAQKLWVYLTALFLIGTAICIGANIKSRSAAILLGLMLLIWIVLLNIPKLLTHLRSGGQWTVVFETLAIFGSACVVAGLAASDDLRPRQAEGGMDSITKVGVICFAVSLPVFGVLHFIYHDYVAVVQPGWIPWHQFWGYFVGVAFVLAGLSIATRIWARSATILLGAMFGIWVLILHGPRVAASIHNRDEWTSLVIALVMCGGSWVIAGSFDSRSPAE